MKLNGLFLGVMTTLAITAQASENTCVVKGMNCAHCVGMVQEKVCSGDKYSACEVSYDADKKVGTIHIVTKDEKTVVNVADLNTAIADTSYKVASCMPSSDKAAKVKKG